NSEEEASDYNKKQTAIAKALNLKIAETIQKPEYSFTANAILSAYNVISRSRRYEQGIPLALDIAAISAYCDHYEIPVERDIFNDCIFAMDNIFLDDSHKKMKRPTKK
ncbi:hypothetical protein, partial [Acinetobacter baumannii]